MATAKQRILRLMDKASQSLNKVLTDTDNMLTPRDINIQFSKAKQQIERLFELSDALFDAEDLEEIYRKGYNSIGNVLRKGDDKVDFSPLPQDKIPDGFIEVRDRYSAAMDAMLDMAEFNLEERKTMQKDFQQSLEDGIKKRESLEKSASRQEIPVNKRQLDQIARSAASSFNPKTGVKKFRNEYYLLGKDDVKNRKDFSKLWGNNWDELSRDMSEIIEKGVESFSTQREITNEMLGRLEQAFPTETKDSNNRRVKNPTFPIAYRDKNGVMQVRRLGMDYYAQLKTDYYSASMDTIGTTDAMLDARMDLVRYTLHGNQDHSDICLTLSNSGTGKIYSISGLSPNYPKLNVYPPAHYNCYSTIDPLPMSKQERYKLTKPEQASVKKDTVEEPQGKNDQFQDNGGQEKPSSKTQAEKRELNG